MKYSTALKQCRTCTTLFLNSTGLVEQSAFTILEKIATVANDTQSRSFHEYQLLDRIVMGHGQSCCNDGHVAILLDCPIEMLSVSGYSDTSCTFICQPTLSLYFHKCSNTRRLTFNLTHEIFYSSNGTHVVVYIPVFTH